MNPTRRISAGRPVLAVIIPTRDRRSLLQATLARLVTFAADEAIEVLVIDDGSADGSARAAQKMFADVPWRAEVLRQPAAGPAAARNRGIRAATATACLFIGDDTLPAADLIRIHRDFHRSNPESSAALLGLTKPAPPLDAEPFQIWLHEDGAQFGYGALDAGEIVSPTCFWTSNVSAKRELLLAAGGFDEGFPGAACEDAELGLRLARLGMRLCYEPGAVTEHFHPTTLKQTIERMNRVGIAMRRLCALAPEMPEPPRPAVRHRVKAAALVAGLSLTRRQRVRQSGWRFVCDQAVRESYHSGPDTPNRRIRHGRLLQRLLESERDANPPPIAFGDQLELSRMASDEHKVARA